MGGAVVARVPHDGAGSHQHDDGGPGQRTSGDHSNSRGSSRPQAPWDYGPRGLTKQGRVAFNSHTATLWAGHVLVTSVSVSKTDGQVVSNPSVIYTSSNALVASVDSTGKVHAHIAGQGTISAAVGSITDELAVTVLWPPVTRVFFADDSLGAFVGDTISPWLYVLNADGNWANNATLTFSSSASCIATALSTYQCCERIAGVGAGRAQISVLAARICDNLLFHVVVRLCTYYAGT